MTAEPGDIAAVEGDKPTPCPTCGGPCRGTGRTVSITPGVQREVESLVKGEVVAEGSARPVRGLTTQWEFFDDWYPEGAAPAVLVIRAKENARTGGKE